MICCYIACVAWRFCREHDWAAKPREKKILLLMSPSKGETAHSCHCPGDISVCMREVLVSPWLVSVCVPLALRLSYYNFYRGKFPAGAEGGAGGAGFRILVTGTDGFFGVWHFQFMDFFGWLNFVREFFAYSTIWSCHSIMLVIRSWCYWWNKRSLGVSSVVRIQKAPKFGMGFIGEANFWPRDYFGL